MLATLLALSVALPTVAPSRAAPPPRGIAVGWHDEMDRLSAWRPLPENAPQTWLPETGGLALRLPHVPDGWPYAYQWSGATREAIVDLGRYPVLMARVDAVDPGYAHLDLEERDVEGRAVRGRRTPALVAPGLIRLDLKPDATMPATRIPATRISGTRDAETRDIRRLTLRLIVGGPNEGAKVVYRWVRFVSRADADRLAAHPDLPVRLAP